MSTPLRILYLEDSPLDVRLAQDNLQHSGLTYELQVVRKRSEYEAAVDQGQFDIILSDYNLPDYDGFAALTLARQKHPNTPFIIVSGALGEEHVLDSIHKGATDYVLKRNLNRLGPAITRALADAEEHRKRQKAEEALRQSEERYRLLADNAEDFVLLNHVDGRRLYVSPSFYRVAGWTPEEFQSGDWRARIHPDDLPLVEKTRAANLAGETTQIEYRMRCKNGSWLWVDTRCKPIAGPDGRVEQMQLWSRDITQRKQAEEALRWSETQLQVTLDSTADGILAVDSQGKVVKANRRFAEIWRIPQSLLETRDDQALLSFVLDQLSEPDAFLKKVMALYPTDAVDMDTLLFKDGRVFERYSSPMLMAGAITGRVWSFRDITERKQAEKALKLFQSLVNHSNDAIEVVDPQTGSFLDVNEMACTSLGYSREELLALKVPDIDPLVDLAAFAGIVEDIRRSGPTIVNSTHRRKDGTTFPVEVSVKLVQLDRAYLVAIARDITERKKAEAALRVRDHAITTAAAGVAIAGADGRLTYVNAAFLKLWGYDNEAEVLGKSAMEFWRDPQEPAQIIVGFDTQDGWMGEMTAKRKDGSFFEASVTASAVRDERGKALHIMGWFLDITERKQAEEALRASEQEFRSLAEAMPQIVWVCKPNGQNIYFNQRWTDCTGLTLEESYGDGWNKPFHPDDQQRAWDAWQNATQNDATYELEVRLQRADGAYRWWLIRGVPLRDANGKILKWFGTCTDIEDIKQAEKLVRALSCRQEAILAAVPDIIVEVDCNTIYTWANQAAVEFFGEDVIGKEAAFYVAGEQETYRDVQSLFNGSDRIIYGESWQRRKDGEKRLLAWWCRALKDERGNVTGALSSGRDITDRKRAEETLRQQAEELRAHNEELERFNRAGVGRELRMIELKEEVNQLCQQAGLPPPYPPNPAIEGEKTGDTPPTETGQP